jgi:hypothetical protein
LVVASSDAQQKLLFDGEDHCDGLLRRIGSTVIGMRSPPRFNTGLITEELATLPA